jgi:hypothetical protein
MWRESSCLLAGDFWITTEDEIYFLSFMIPNLITAVFIRSCDTAAALSRHVLRSNEI